MTASSPSSYRRRPDPKPHPHGEAPGRPREVRAAAGRRRGPRLRGARRPLRGLRLHGAALRGGPRLRRLQLRQRVREREVRGVYCVACVRLEKDRDGCPAVVNVGTAMVDSFYQRKKHGFNNNPRGGPVDDSR